MPVGAQRATADGWRRALPVAIGLALVPFAVAIVVSLLDGGHTAISDRALMELRIRDVGVHPVTIGLYSRDGWAHPGPALYYLLAVPYRLFGSDMNALMVGSLAVNGAAVVTMGLVARRVGGLGAGLVMLVAASAVSRSLGMELLTDPWVCWITVLPLGTFCLLTWAMADGRIWSLPVTAIVATFLMQTHVGFVPITLPALLVGTVWLAVRVRRSRPERTRALVGAGGLSLAALAVLWFPPLWDEWEGSGNLSTIVRWFRDNTETPHTLTDGARIVGGQFALVPDWITGTRRIGFDGATSLLRTTLLPVLLVPFLVALVVAFRRRDRVARALLVMSAVTVAAGVVAVARTTGTMYEYRLLWTWTLAAVVTAAAAIALWRWLGPRLPAVARPAVTVALLVVLLGLTVAQTVDALDADRSYAWDSPDVAQAVAQATRHLRREGGQVLVSGETFVGNWYQQGVLLALEHDGFDARVVRDAAEIYGHHRERDPHRPVQADLLVLANSEVIDFRGRPGYSVIGFGAKRSRAATVAAGKRLEARQRALLELRRQHKISSDELARRALALPDAPSAVLILRRDT
jgi:hypothetical protein